MKFTISWLKQYIDPGLTAAEVADRLTMAGLEVDSVQELFADLSDIKVAKVLAIERHPNADKLTVCKVAVGDEEKQIVCGAPNVRAGLTTAVALPGARLPSGLVIKKAKLRGVESQGMLCSAKELEVSVRPTASWSCRIRSKAAPCSSTPWGCGIPSWRWTSLPTGPIARASSASPGKPGASPAGR
ncbi:MAG: hypothetical protein P8Y63_01810 [Deltaproteobacteria bacterium]